MSLLSPWKRVRFVLADNEEFEERAYLPIAVGASPGRVFSVAAIFDLDGRPVEIEVLYADEVEEKT